MSIEKTNMELMQTLDDAWNNQDWDTFDKRHKTDTVVRWPAQPPTHGIRDHRAEGVQMFKTFPDNRVENRPYKTFFASVEQLVRASSPLVEAAERFLHALAPDAPSEHRNDRRDEVPKALERNFGQHRRQASRLMPAFFKRVSYSNQRFVCSRPSWAR